MTILRLLSVPKCLDLKPSRCDTPSHQEGDEKQLGRFSRHRKVNSQVAGFAVLGLVLTTLVVMTPTSATSSNSNDTSSAVRYNDDGSPIGEVVKEFVGQDDTTKKIEAPFPINFFGDRLPALCLTTNGLVYPIASVGANCSPKFDKSLEILTVGSKASAIAPLALDLRLSGDRLWNPQLKSVNELSLTQFTSLHNASSGNTLVTVTTDAPHGFLVGDKINKSFNSPDFVGNSFFSQEIVTSTPSPTTYTVLVSDESGENVIANDTYAPTNGERTVVYRLPVRERVTELQLSGTTLRLTTSDNLNIGIGRKFTLAGLGNPDLDGRKLVVDTQVSSNIFTATVADLSDLDAHTDGNQNEVSFSGNDRPWALERDEAGAIQQVYFGPTVVDGRDAYAITWYRATNYERSTSGVNSALFPAINPPSLSFTIQLVIVKRSSGSDSIGWDFDYEFNIGHADDPSDGYSASNPAASCSVFSLVNCRWAIGTARYIAGPEVSSISFDGSVVTLITTTPHGFEVGKGVAPSGLDSVLSEDLGYVPAVISEVVDEFTIKFPTQDQGDPVTLVQVSNLSPRATVGYAEAYELFPDNSSLELVDSGGATALVRNSLNTSVLGRYTLGMAGGVVAGFVAPTMGSANGGAAPAGPSEGAAQLMSVFEVSPTIIKAKKNKSPKEETITILGSNLNTVTEVYIGGVKVPIFTQLGNRLQVKAPKGLSGLVDLELKSSLNNSLMAKKLNFVVVAANGAKKKTLVVGGFAPNSKELTQKMKNSIANWLAKHSDLSSLTCTGFTSLPRRTTDLTLSTNRGEKACDFSKRQRAELDTSVSQGIEDPRPGPNIRRVRLVLKP
jgi:hypothetical protein